MVGASCTAELIQDDPGGLTKALNLPVPVVPLELPAYSKKENWGSAETFYQMVRSLAGPNAPAPGFVREMGAKPSCNILGPTALGFRHRDDVAEIIKLLGQLGVDVRCHGASRCPSGRSGAAGRRRFQRRALPRDGRHRRRLARAHLQAASDQTVPIGVGATRRLHRRGGRDHRHRPDAGAERRQFAAALVLALDRLHLPDGKRVFVFGDATHAIAAARVAADEFGFEVVGLGTYSREFARDVRKAAEAVRPRGADHRRLSRGRAGRWPRRSAELRARHADGAAHRQAAGHRLRGDLRSDACPGLSRPLLAADGLRGRQRPVRHLGASADDGPGGASARHVPRGLRVPRRRRPLASRPGHAAAAPAGVEVGPRRNGQAEAAPVGADGPMAAADGPSSWAPDAEHELKKIPFFVRGKARRNTERFAKPIVGSPSSPSRPCTMRNRISAADPRRPVRVTLSRWTATRLAPSRASATTLARDDPWPRAEPARGSRVRRRRSASLDALSADIDQADIVFVLACCSWRTTSRPCCPALQARRDDCDAMICCMSADEVIKLTRIGRFTMDRPKQSGAMALLKRLQAEAQDNQPERRRPADDDAAPAAEDPPLRPGHGPGRCAPTSSRCSTGSRARTRTSPTWSVGWSIATPTVRKACCAARWTQDCPSSTPISASTTRGSRAG